MGLVNIENTLSTGFLTSERERCAPLAPRAAGNTHSPSCGGTRSRKAGNTGRGRKCRVTACVESLSARLGAKGQYIPGASKFWGGRLHESRTTNHESRTMDNDHHCPGYRIFTFHGDCQFYFQNSYNSNHYFSKLIRNPVFLLSSPF